MNEIMTVKAVKAISFLAFVIFIAVGLLFVLIPENVLIFFNDISDALGLVKSVITDGGFYLALASAYMYIVAILAWLMFRHPEDKKYPFLLANAKLASSVLSLFFFIFRSAELIYITNCIVDGLIGIAALVYFLKLKGR
ncbi:MAG: hypothetical protein ACYCYI_09715 [Saccharofermentanales bacterium]